MSGWKREKRKRKPEQNGLAKLTVRRPSEIVAMQFSPSDLLLENGYLVKGDSLAICGAGGVGKSRLCTQLLIAVVTGRDSSGGRHMEKAPVG